MLYKQMIYYVGTPVPAEWYTSDHDVMRYPFFEFKFIRTCIVKKAHDVFFIKALDGLPGQVLHVDNVDDCTIDFPMNFVTRGNIDQAINDWGYRRNDH